MSHDTSTLWDQYIRTQGLTIPDPLYKSPGTRHRVKKPRHYAATPEEHYHQEQCNGHYNRTPDLGSV